jgi:hypothetical protein
MTHCLSATLEHRSGPIKVYYDVFGSVGYPVSIMTPRRIDVSKVAARYSAYCDVWARACMACDDVLLMEAQKGYSEAMKNRIALS